MIAFLQNAWSPVYAGREWPRKAWLRALERSRSGKRLRLLGLPWDAYHNTTPEVGPKPSSKLPPRPAHIQVILEREEPRLVITLGRQAEDALLELWDGPMLALPHPAFRLLTDELYHRARELIDDGIDFRLALRQRRGMIAAEELEARA